MVRIRVASRPLEYPAREQTHRALPRESPRDRSAARCHGSFIKFALSVPVPPPFLPPTRGFTDYRASLNASFNSRVISGEARSNRANVWYAFKVSFSDFHPTSEKRIVGKCRACTRNAGCCNLTNQGGDSKRERRRKIGFENLFTAWLNFGWS